MKPDRPKPWPGAPVCRFCGVTLTPHEAVTRRICDSEPCEDAFMREMTESIARRDVARHEERRAEAVAAAGPLLDAAAASLGVPVAEAMVAVVPHVDRPIGTLPETRRAAFEAHLDHIIGQDVEDPFDAATPVSPAPRENEAGELALLDACCATCQGSCCTLGAHSHAFLSWVDMRRWRLRHPEAEPGAARAAYLAHLPEVSMEDSCVYHGPLGCTLPRTLRADICNMFHCAGQNRLMGDLEAAGLGAEAPVAIIAQESGEVRAAAAHDAAGGWRPVAPSQDPAASAGTAAAGAQATAKAPATTGEGAPVDAAG